LLGIGYLEDIPNIIREGIDTFDCTVPTHYARRSIAFTSQGELRLDKTTYLQDHSSLDPQCVCTVCSRYTRAYLAHLLRAKESTAGTLLTIHNLFFFNHFVEQIRNDIKSGKV